MSQSNNKIKLNNYDRSEVKKYFYGTNLPKIVAMGGVLAGILLQFVAGSGLKVIVISLIAAAVIWFYETCLTNSSAEKIYDELLQEDLKCLEKISLRKLGLVSEQVNMIEPIKVTASGSYDVIIEEDTTENKIAKGLMKILGAIAAIIFKIVFFIFTIPVKFIKMIMGMNEEYVPVLKYKNGTDDKLRYSIIKAHIFYFSENQVFVYVVNYDICSGEVFSEATSEYFYRDIDSVVTGEKIKKVFIGKKIIDKRYEFFNLTVTSGTSTKALIDSEFSNIEDQLMGMKELIRNKKMEMN